MSDPKKTTCAAEGCNIYSYLAKRARRRWFCNEHKQLGVAPHTIVRADDPDTSFAAGRSVDTTRGEARALSYITAAIYGLTVKEYAQIQGTQMSSISSRFSGLFQKGLIEDTGERRDGCRVMARTIFPPRPHRDELEEATK